MGGDLEREELQRLERVGRSADQLIHLPVDEPQISSSTCEAFFMGEIPKEKFLFLVLVLEATLALTSTASECRSMKEASSGAFILHFDAEGAAIDHLFHVLQSCRIRVAAEVETR